MESEWNGPTYSAPLPETKQVPLWLHCSSTVEQPKQRGVESPGNSPECARPRALVCASPLWRASRRVPWLGWTPAQLAQPSGAALTSGPRRTAAAFHCPFSVTVGVGASRRRQPGKGTGRRTQRRTIFRGQPTMRDEKKREGGKEEEATTLTVPSPALAFILLSGRAFQ